MIEFTNFHEKCSEVNGITNFIKSLPDKIKAFDFICYYKESTRQLRRDVFTSEHYFNFERDLVFEIFNTDNDKFKITILFTRWRKLIDKRYEIGGVRRADPIFTIEQVVEIYNNIDIEHYDDKETFIFIYYRHKDIPIEILEMLIRKFHNINYEDVIGRTLLNIFIVKNRPNLRIMNYLIVNGANINHCNKHGTSILLASLNKNCLEIVKLLVDNNVVVDEKSLEKIKKCNKHIREIFKFLI
jgi:hypothetical protein